MDIEPKINPDDYTEDELRYMMKLYVENPGPGLMCLPVLLINNTSMISIEVLNDKIRALDAKASNSNK